MASRAVKGHFLAWRQVGVTVVLVARGSESGAAKCALGHMSAASPGSQPSYFTNGEYAVKIPCELDFQPRRPTAT